MSVAQSFRGSKDSSLSSCQSNAGIQNETTAKNKRELLSTRKRFPHFHTARILKNSLQQIVFHRRGAQKGFFFSI